MGSFPKRHKVNSTYLSLPTIPYADSSYASLQSTAMHISYVVFDHSLPSYRIPTYIPTHNSTQFLRKFFATMCTLLVVKNLQTTALHPQKNGQFERFKNTILERHRHYVAEYQKNWDTFVQRVTNAYNTQTHRSKTQPHSAFALEDTHQHRSFCNPTTQYHPTPVTKHHCESSVLD